MSNSLICDLKVCVTAAETAASQFVYTTVSMWNMNIQVRSLRTQTSASDANKLSMEASKTVLVFFVGGYTMSEVAAFRQLQTSTGYHFIIAGTSNLSGRYFAESVIERAMS